MSHRSSAAPLGLSPTFPDTGNESTSDRPVFSASDLLDRVMGDWVVARLVASAFLEDLPRQLECLRTYVETGDAKGAERQAHTIKGAAAAVSGDVLMGLAEGIERAANGGDLEPARAVLPELDAQFVRLKAAMLESNLFHGAKEDAS